METTYIITFVVDGRDWSSRPIKGSLQEATDEAKDQLRISIFYGKKPYGAGHISNNAINAGIICGDGIKKPKVNQELNILMITS